MNLPHPADIALSFANEWNRRDASAIAELFDEDAEFVNVVGLWWHDREAIRKAHAYGLRTIFQHSTLEVVHTKVKMLSPEFAVVHARMKLTGQTAINGVSTPGMRQTIFSFVMRKTDEGWRCASAHNTDVVLGAETNVSDETGHLRPTSYRRA